MSSKPPDFDLGFDWDVDKQWTVADRGERRPIGQARFVVVPWEHIPARPIIHPSAWQAKNGGKDRVDTSSPALSLSAGTPMTFEEASESARLMNEMLDVMES